MKILVISHMYPSTLSKIAGIFVLNQVEELKRQGCDLKVVCPIPAAPFPAPYLSKKWENYSRAPFRAKIEDIDVFYPRYFAFPRRLFYASAGERMFLGIERAVNEIYNEFKFDLVHCHACYPDGFAGALIKNKFCVPLVITVHGDDLREISIVSRSMKSRIMHSLRAADRVISPHPELTEILEGLKILKVSEIFNSINLELFSPDIDGSGIKKEFNLEGKRVVSFVANLVDIIKDPQTFVSAALYVLKRNKNVVFLVVGDGPLKKNLIELIKKAGMDSSVIFVGERNDVSAILAATDIFCVLGTFENLWGTNLLEAMAAKVPLVITKVGTTTKYLEHKKNAYLVKPRDPRAVGEAVLYLLSHEGLSQKISAAARKLAEEKLDSCVSARRIKELYSELITGTVAKR